MGLRSWFTRRQKPQQSRTELATAELLRRIQRARYDAAGSSDEYSNIWANADAYDADSAHSREVRGKLSQRARYEMANNGYSDGIAQTYATDLIGNGPTLRMQTGSVGFNRMVETSFWLWWKATHMRRKLWCMAHAKHVDGESLATLRLNPSVNHAIRLDVLLHEAEQCQTPYVPFEDRYYIDGIKFDQFGNPVWYDFLREHPGSSGRMLVDQTPERVPADRVLHWFKMRRPGQHRGVSEIASTLNVGAASRRWREATLAAAETAAEFSLFLKTTLDPEQVDAVSPMSTLDIQKRMMTALPMGWEAFQPKAEQPTAQYAEFSKALINEQARCKNMPYNKAACDSSSYNYASGRLDHQTYYAALDVEREDCNDLVLEPLFDLWFDLAIARFGWLGGNPEVVGPAARIHLWDWPKHRVADVEAEANANETKLTSGQIGLHRLYSDAGLDLEDEVDSMAASYGVTADEIRTRLFDIVLPPAQQQQTRPDSGPVAAATAAILSRVNGNGVHHEN